MRQFKHITPATIREATSILKESQGKARIIAGGTDLLGEMKDEILPVYPEVLVNLKSIPGLDYIKEKNGQLLIGALTRIEDIAVSRTIKEKYGALAEAAHRTASPHIREMGTIAGNICQNNRCWYYWVPDNRFDCLRKGGKACYALTGDGRYHSIFGATRVFETPCSRACPDNIDIADYMSKLRDGGKAEASRILLRNNPFPAITGRVCPHYCEKDCNRGDFDQSVSIKGVERSIGEYVLGNAGKVYVAPKLKSGKKVSIIGSGPAGLSAAYYLRQAGHEVSVYERMSEAGGLLTYGIPPYRLPKEIVRKQIDALKKMGIKIVADHDIDRNKLRDLIASSDAVLLACGAWKERESGIPGEEYLESGMEFLKNSNRADKEYAGKKVAVIGGGNVAIDVARSLLRLGAEPTVIYRRTLSEMPALTDEVEKAQEEDIRFEFLTLPVESSSKKGKVILKCIRMKLGPPDESGRPRPLPIKGSAFSAEYDVVMKAVGEAPDVSILPSGLVNAAGRLKIKEQTCSLARGVYAAGDFVSGPTTVVAAIAAGRKAAESIGHFLAGAGAAKEPGKKSGGRGAEKFNSAYLQETPRSSPPELQASERVKELTLEEVGGLGKDEVVKEANRCFNCGCVAVNSSDIAPVLIALGAKIKTSRRVIEADEFFMVGVDQTTVLKDDEIVMEIQVPEQGGESHSKFIKLAIRKSIDFPIVNCAAAISAHDGVVNSVRICLNSVYNLPYRVCAAEEYMLGKTIGESNAEAAAEVGLQGAFSVVNNRYKIQIARALVKRAILACGKLGGLD
jgi:NADPH-dependent glutamate synthase beta subunit-like oxidoreductase/CO/xanthine dehydrogenase FAD-binding subunit